MGLLEGMAEWVGGHGSRGCYLEDVDHACHLRVDEDAVISRLQPRQQTVEDGQLAGIRHQRLLVCRATA